MSDKRVARNWVILSSTSVTKPEDLGDMKYEDEIREVYRPRGTTGLRHGGKRICEL